MSSTSTAALLYVARGAARPDIPTPVRLLSIWRRSRRRIQTSSLFAASNLSVGTRAACRRTNGTARGRPPPVSKFALYLVPSPPPPQRPPRERESPLCRSITHRKVAASARSCSGYCAAPRRASRGRAIFFIIGTRCFSTASPPARPGSGASACAAASRTSRCGPSSRPGMGRPAAAAAARRRPRARRRSARAL